MDKRTLSRFLTRTFRTWNVPIFALVVALGLAIGGPGARAQSGAGSIQGTVQDSTHAVIPGATIKVVSTATNVAVTTKSNGVGFYQVPGLFTGTYSVTVTAPNMKTYKTSVQLLVAQNAVINPVMTAGQVTQQVEVAASVVQLTTTDSGTISSTLENARINQLPMNGRNILTLAGETTPGLEGGGTRANGLMGEAMEYVADGAPLTNRQFGGMMQGVSTPDPDAVQEVRVETTNTSAQYTEPGTAIVTTKSGTNRLHGALFETARNNALGLAKRRQDPANFAAPHLVRNEYGASAGGPIIIPHVYHGKDKSFWFFAWEKYSLVSNNSTLFHVPTPAMRQGDFSGLVNGSGVLQQLYDPATTRNDSNCAATGAANPYCRDAFANNQIPVGRESPAMKMINDITPLPNLSYNPLVQANLQGNTPNDTMIPTFTFRLDHAFNENNRVYLRYNSNTATVHSLRNYPVSEPALGGADGFPAEATGASYNPSATFAGALGFTHVFSPTFFSETILSNQWFSQHNYAGGTPFANFEKKLGLPNNFGEGGFPNFGENGSRLINPIDGTQFIYGLSQLVTNLDENLTKTIGRHQLQFGGRYRHERFGYLPDEHEDNVQFSTLATSLYDTSTGKNYGGLANQGNQNGDAFLGAASYFSVNLQPPYAHFHDMEFDAYFQDNYHATRDLTLNLGLRWESHPATWLKYGTMESFDLKNDALVLSSSPAKLIAAGFTTQPIITNMENIGVKFETPSEAGLPDKQAYDYNLNFSPRLGFAYQPFGGRHGTVIRGAYGRYIYPIPVRTTYKPILQNRPYSSTYSQSYNSATQSPDGIQNYLLRNNQPTVLGVNTANAVDSTSTTAFLPGITVYTLNPKQPPDFVTQTNFTIEQPLKGNSVLRLTWLWSHGTNLDQEYYYNEHPSTYVWEMQTGTLTPQGKTIGQPNYASTGTGPYDQITWGGGNIVDQKSGWSNDNAFQINYQRLFHHGVAYQIFYVWSKPFRVGGNYFRDGQLYTAQAYGNSGQGVMSPVPNSSAITSPALPPARPAGAASYAYWHNLDVYENYQLDTAIPKHHIQFNGLVQLPFGRGKRFMGNANRFLDEVVGGFQIAGAGSIVSQDFQVANGNWGPSNPIHVYKHKAKVTDCRSGTCLEAYEWFNGYLAPSVTSACSNGKCVTGLPSGYAPYSQPINTNYNPTTPNGKAQDANYNTNNVNITLLDGSTVKTGYSPGPRAVNPYAKTFLDGPFNYNVDLSVFKVFPITESMRLRFNVDAFNALNVQGFNNPNSTDGVEVMTSSHNSPRQLQLTLRLEF